MKMASAACMYTHRGGLTIKNLTFPRGYHIEYGGGMNMPGYGFGFGMEKTNGKYPVVMASKKQPVVMVLH